jgi:CheY-like chemotaxis protein/predicted XRE-type DNA-binding protein
MTELEVRTLFATALRRWRHQRGLSQEDLAERADLHRTYISDVERSARNLSLGSIHKLAQALDISAATLFLPSEPSAGQPTATPRAGLAPILVVEDQPGDEKLILETLKQAPCANSVHVVRSATETVEFLGSHEGGTPEESPALILFSLSQPKDRSLDLLRRLKTEARTQTIPLVVLTGSETDPEIAKCRRLGVETFLTKPLSLFKLSGALRQLHLGWALVKTPLPPPVL